MSERNTSETVVFRPVVTKRASEVIYDQIRDRIIRRELVPGDRLPGEKDMMELFQRSRPTVREALRMLERNGFIRTIPGSGGAVVLERNDSGMGQIMEEALQSGFVTLQEMSEYRSACETAVAEWAAERRTQKDLAVLAENLSQMKESLDDTARFPDLDQSFHTLLAGAAHNEVAVMMVRSMAGFNKDFMKKKASMMSDAARKKMRRRVYRHHQAIFEAVEKGDRDAARHAMTEHMDAFQADLRTDREFV